MPPSYIRVRAVVWAYGRGQTDTQTHTHAQTQMRVTTIHFVLSTTHAKCNESSAQLSQRTLYAVSLEVGPMSRRFLRYWTKYAFLRTRMI